MWLLLAFVAVPMIEIALFIQVGGVIGLGWTLAIVLFTAVLGTWLVRAQGAMALNRIQRSFSELSDPSEPLADGAMILIAGVLLLTPGFFTDAVGLSLLMPPVRHAVFSYARQRITVQRFSTQGQNRTKSAQPGHGDVIDGEYSEVDTPKQPTHRPPSQWTRH